MMRMTKLPDGWYVATPETEEERDLLRRSMAAFYAFQDPDVVRAPRAIGANDEDIKEAGMSFDEMFAQDLDCVCIPEAPEGSICLHPIIKDERRFYRAWAAAFNTFMEQWEQDELCANESEVTGHCTQANDHAEDPSLFLDDHFHNIQT